MRKLRLALGIGALAALIQGGCRGEFAAECEAGLEGCECLEGTTCVEGLSCLSGLCVGEDAEDSETNASEVGSSDESSSSASGDGDSGDGDGEGDGDGDGDSGDGDGDSGDGDGDTGDGDGDSGDGDGDSGDGDGDSGDGDGEGEGAQEPRPMLAWGSQQSEFLMVWSQDTATVGEREIFGQRLSPAGAAVGQEFQISSQGPEGDADYDAVDPDVVYNATTQEFLVLWSGHRTATDIEIYAQRLAGDGAAQDSAIRVSMRGADTDMPPLRCRQVAASWDSTENEYLAVWSGERSADDWEIYSALLDSTATPQLSFDVQVSSHGEIGDTQFGAYNPDVVYAVAGPARHHVAWSADATPGEREIYIASVATDGMGDNPQRRVTHLGPDDDPAFDANDPSIEYGVQNGIGMLVWSGDSNQGGVVDNEFELYGELFTGDGGAIGSSGPPIVRVGPDGDPAWDVLDPSIVRTQTEYLVVWAGSEEYFNTTVSGEHEIWGHRFGGTAALVGETERITDFGPAQSGAHDASRPVLALPGVASTDPVVAWQGNETDPSPDVLDVHVQPWSSP